METAKHKPKRGDVREDGMIFWGNIHKKPYWLSPEKFEQYRSKEKESAKRNFLKNHDERLKKLKEYYNQNKEKFNEASKKWVKDNPEKRKLLTQRYYQNNKEKVESANRNWRNNNPEKIKIISKRINAGRREKIKNANGLTKDQKKIMECFYEQTHRLQKKLGIKFHVDHIVPLSRGGLHIPTNLQVLPASLNVKKHAREVYRWSELQLN